MSDGLKKVSKKRCLTFILKQRFFLFGWEEENRRKKFKRLTA